MPTKTSQQTTSRRAFLLTSAATPIAGALLVEKVNANTPTSDAFSYEVTRTDAEWREMLTQEQYHVLREGGTELPANGPLWKDFTEGSFHCRGCDLHVYDSDWRVKINKGWIFFKHAQKDAILTDVDQASELTMNMQDTRTITETHCRRCGSHLGHLVYIEKQMVHCINAASLVRQPKIS